MSALAVKQLLLLGALAVFLQPLADSKEPLPVADSSGDCALWGRVIAPSPSLENVDVQLLGGKPKVHQRVHLVNGSFQFKRVPAGSYQFRVLGPSGRVIATWTQDLNGVDDHLWLHLPPYRSEAGRANTISLERLRGQIASGAVRAFRDGQKADEVGDVSRSIEDFAKAASLHPNFAAAEGNLAIEYLRIGNHTVALEHAEAAHSADPGDPGIAQVLASLLIHAKRYRDAERIIRLLLGRDDDRAEWHELLAISLIGEHGDIDDALSHLKLAAAEVPTARLLVASALLDNQRVSLALLQVREFIRTSASVCERPLLEEWVSKVSNIHTTFTTTP